MKFLDKLLFLFAGVFAVLDIITTLFALRSPLLYETNPLGVYIPFLIKFGALFGSGILFHKLGENLTLSKWMLRIAVIILSLSWINCALNNFHLIS